VGTRSSAWCPHMLKSTNNHSWGGSGRFARQRCKLDGVSRNGLKKINPKSLLPPCSQAANPDGHLPSRLRIVQAQDCVKDVQTKKLQRCRRQSRGGFCGGSVLVTLAHFAGFAPSRPSSLFTKWSGRSEGIAGTGGGGETGEKSGKNGRSARLGSRCIFVEAEDGALRKKASEMGPPGGA